MVGTNYITLLGGLWFFSCLDLWLGVGKTHGWDAFFHPSLSCKGSGLEYSHAVALCFVAWQKMIPLLKWIGPHCNRLTTVNSGGEATTYYLPIACQMPLFIVNFWCVKKKKKLPLLRRMPHPDCCSVQLGKKIYKLLLKLDCTAPTVLKKEVINYAEKGLFPF